jgi:hypothetical protein
MPELQRCGVGRGAMCSAVNDVSGSRHPIRIVV